MKTINFFMMLGITFLVLSCQKSKGLEKSGGNYPRNYIYAGLELHESKYYRWEGDNSFTELSNISFPEYHDNAELNNTIIEYYDLFYPFLEFTLESDTTLRLITRETEDFPALDTIGGYINNETSYDFGDLGFPYIWYPNEDLSQIKNRGHAYNFNYYNDFKERREYFALSVTEAARLEKTEQDLLEEIVSINQPWLQPSDTIQLKFYEVVHELE